MFKTVFIRSFLLIGLVHLSGNFMLQAQIPPDELPSLKKRAIENFEKGEYSAAEYDFSKLIKQFPSNPLYRYYSGICKIERNRDLEEAVELLHFASTRGVPEDVYYYLGEAYRMLYDFKRAKTNYEIFDKVAPKNLARQKNSKFLIKSAVAALQITSSYNTYKLLSLSYIDLRDPEEYSRIRMKGGTLTSKPEAFFSVNEDHFDINSLMFMPKIVERGQAIYYSATDISHREGFQIMKAIKGNKGKWKNIEAIEAINTEMNEILPYFDPIGHDLYFASDGLEGLGGFDIFRSHYDEEQNKWSDPINLGFPINSVYDDYLFLPGTDLGLVTIFSGRKTSNGQIAVYRLQLSEPKQSLATAIPETKRKIAELGANNGAFQNEYSGIYDQQDSASKINPTPKDTDEIREKQDIIEESPMKIDEASQEIISRALRHESISDSLTELASKARIKVRSISDPDERWNVQKQIISLEKRAGEELKKADEVFALLINSTGDSIPKTIVVDTIINGLTKYKYVIQDSIAEIAKSAFNSSTSKTENEDSTKETATKDVLTHANLKSSAHSQQLNDSNYFEKLETSRYNADNPIPLNDTIPQGAYYKIQLGVYSRQLKPDVFKGLTPISAETIPKRNLTKYFAGSFTNFENADKALPIVRASGFKDAFIVAWYNGKIMSIEKVKKLEN